MADEIRARSGGCLTIYTLPHNLAVFDMTAALDTTITDMARGLLWRALALYARSTYAQDADWKSDLGVFLANAAEGIDAARACLRELADAGYVRKYQEDGRWTVQFAAMPVFEGDQLREEYQTSVPFLALTAEKPKVKRKRTGKKSPAPEEHAHAKAARHAIKVWYTAEAGAGMVVLPRQWSRVMQSIGNIIVVAEQLGWLDDDADGSQTMLHVDTCWAWIKRHAPYKGALDIHNVASRIQEWWNLEGRGTLDAPRDAEAPVYMPVSIE